MTDRDDDVSQAEPSEDRNFIRDSFGMICLLGAFLIFVVVMAPMLGPLLLHMP